MEICFNIALELNKAVATAAHSLPQFDESFDPAIRPADPRFGDFQANGVLPYAKRNRINPRQAALDLCRSLSETECLNPDYLSFEVAGAGFINFQLTPAFITEWLQKYQTETDLRDAAEQIYRGKTVVVDFSSPNTAKQLHVGHIRSTVLGEAIHQLLSFCGARVIRDNHIGDWGTQFGILIMAIKRRKWDHSRIRHASIDTIEELYREGYDLTINESEALEVARNERVKLQRGDPENLKIWESINAISYRSFEEIYQQLNIHFDEVLGESFYRDKVDTVYEELSKYRIAVESEGALVVFHPEHKRFRDQPFIIRNSDGAANYNTSDLATLLYRAEHFVANEIIYVVDSRQSDHFEQLFLTAQKWFKARESEIPNLHYVSFGLILAEQGKAISTREGSETKLKDLLSEAVERAFRVVTEKNPELSEEERKRVAKAVGLGAIRYADLMQNRTSDYQFSWERMLSLEGNTAPYLLYAVARIHSIFRKADIDPYDLSESDSDFESANEIALARKIVGFVTALNQATADLRPHYLSTYLYELAGIFSTFYNSDKVIVDQLPTRNRRLMLCARALTILETGLHLLGLETLERM